MFNIDYDAQYEEAVAKEYFLRSHMTSYRMEAMKKLSQIIHKDYIEAIAETIAVSLQHSKDVKIVDDLGLTDKHLAAMTDDLEWMDRIIQDEYTYNKIFKDIY